MGEMGPMIGEKRILERFFAPAAIAAARRGAGRRGHARTLGGKLN